MFKDYWKYSWVLKEYRYEQLDDLLAALPSHIIEPAEVKAKELVQRRNEAYV